MGLLTVNNVSRTPRVGWPPHAMPQYNARQLSSDLDNIDPQATIKDPQPGVILEKRKKKDKRWSIGGLFRRKKKVNDSTDSSSPVEDEEDKKGFLERRRAARKRKNRGSKDVTGSFEHVIINHPRNQLLENASNENTRDTSKERLSKVTREPFSRRQQDGNYMRGSSVSLEGTSRKERKSKSKSRVDTNRFKPTSGSSTDDAEETLKHSTTSLQKAKSDETSGSKDGSLSRRSRAARTERYKKRLSRDEDFFKDYQSEPKRLSRSDERISSNKPTDRESSANKWTAKVVYCESSDYDTKYTAKTKSATPSPVQSPKTRPKNALHYTTSAPVGSTYVTFPPSHAKDGGVRLQQELRGFHPRAKPIQRYEDVTPPRLPKGNTDTIGKANNTNSAFNQSTPWRDDNLNRKSASYDCNVNSLHHTNFYKQTHIADDDVLVVQFPISIIPQKSDSKSAKISGSSQKTSKRLNPPPPPPPRDPNRKLVSNKENNNKKSPRPMSYAFEDRNQHARYPGLTEFGSIASAFQRVPQPLLQDILPSPVINKHHRSNSDNHISARVQTVKTSPPVHRRPSSVHPDINEFSRSSRDMQSQNNYQYFTDEQPRSRKPIHIAYDQQKVHSDPYLSDSQVVVKPPLLQSYRTRPVGVQNASEFWKQMDQESAKKVYVSEGSPKLIQKHFLNVNETNNARSRSQSPQVDNYVVSARMKLPPITIPVRGLQSPGSLSNQTISHGPSSPRILSGKHNVHNEIGIPVFEAAEINCNTKRDFRPLSMLEEKHEMPEQVSSPLRENQGTAPIPPTRRDSKVNAVTNFEHFDVLDDDFYLNEGRRKSSNLEDALNELEAIYKSLRLDEEGYIEKIEKEKALYENNRLDPSNWNAWVQSRGFESDSSFNYSRSSLESVDSVDSPIKRSNVKRSGVPDRVTDDMAYRRLNKTDRPSPHEQEVISQAGSFLLVSPTLSPPPFIEPPPVPITKKEPDITLDDVVYRNITHINNSLKVLDPQPPFGIPLGPITPAPNSDYLHATPKETYRPTFKPRKTPDIVTDDLAFRNLRKDNNKEPLFSVEDTTLLDSPTLRKKRAVRSLSANLLSIIQKESMNNNKLIYNNNNIKNDLEKSESFTDIINANVINFQIQPVRQIGDYKKQSGVMAIKSLNGEDSDSTAPGSKLISSEDGSPLFTTSTETLTGSKSSIFFQDTRHNNNLSSNNSSRRLSLTPERRHTTDNLPHLSRKSLSPSKHVPIKLIPFNKDAFLLGTNDRTSPEFKRSPTPDSHTFTYNNDIKSEKTEQRCNKTESDLLAALAKEAKETSEQLSKELCELNIEDTKMLSTESDEQEKSPTKHVPNQVHSKLSLGKITPHIPVKLNTFCITSDNKLENKQAFMNSSGNIEGSKSMTDLLNELTKDLDLDFGDSPETENKNPNLTYSAENVSIEELPNENSDDQSKATTISDKSVESKSLISTVASTENEESSQKHCLDENLSTPERVLLSVFPEDNSPEIKILQRTDTLSPVNRFPLIIPDDASDGNPCQEERTFCRRQSAPVQSDDPQPSQRCPLDCTSLADEGTKSARRCADPVTLLVCMACAHQLAGLDFLTILGLILAVATVILFLVL